MPETSCDELALAAEVGQLRGHLYHYLTDADGAVTCVDCDMRLLSGKLAGPLPAPSTLHALEAHVEIVVPGRAAVALPLQRGCLVAKAR